MNAIESRIARLEHLIAPDPSLQSTDKPVIDQLAILGRTINDIFRDHPVLRQYLALQPRLSVEDEGRLNLTDDELAQRRVVVNSHANDISYLAASLDTVVSLAHSSLDNSARLPTSAQASEVEQLAARATAVEQTTAVLLARSVALFERLLARSIIGANHSWAEIEHRLARLNTHLRRIESARSSRI